MNYLATAAAIAAMIGAGLARAGDWPNFLGPNRDGKSTETGLLKKWPENGPPLLWRVSAGEGYATASVADGRVYFFDRVGDRSRLACLEAATGKTLWRADYEMAYEDMYGFGTGPRANPTVDGDRVYTYGVEGELRCWNASDGSLVWKVDASSRFGVVKNFFGVGSSPVIEGDLVIATVGGSPPDSPGVRTGETRGAGSGIVAFDKMTGAVRYQLSDELASYATPQVTTIGGRRLGLAFMRGGLVGFDPAAGAQTFFFPWRAKRVETVNAATPVIVGDRAFLTESYEKGGVLLRVRQDGVEPVWQDPPRRGQSMACHWMTPIHHEGYLYGSHGQKSGNAELRCVSLETGAVQWRKPGLRRTTLLYADGMLITLGEYGELWLFEANPKACVQLAAATPKLDGKPLLARPAWNAPVLANGRLYVRGADALACFDLRAK